MPYIPRARDITITYSNHMLQLIIIHNTCRFSTSYTPCPNVELVESVWDFKKWLEPYTHRLEKDSLYLVYQFTLNEGRAQMDYKQFTCVLWEPAENGVTILYCNGDYSLETESSCA